MACDEPDRIIELVTHFPEFKQMYETLYQMCLNVERVMDMFSEELRILDRNTVKYMIEEQQQEIDSLKDERRKAIENMLRENMTVEKIVSLLNCDQTLVEEIKNEM